MATLVSKGYLNLKATHFSGGSRPTDKGWGGGGGHPDPDIRGVGLQKNFFSALRASVWSTIKGGRPPRAPPLDPPLHFENDENRTVASTRLERL